MDFLYQSEWETFEHEGFLRLHTAFSRDNPARKVYVQHLMRQEEVSAQLWAIVSRGGTIFIAGNTKMPSEVKKAVVESICLHGEMDPTRADALLRHMQREGRYKVEAWS
jgi:sulfite reductase alpha subunit-like flavoprotein